MPAETPRLLILGAHPDDAEYHAGGLATIYRQHGYGVKIVSATDGGAGHHERSAEELVPLRRAEATAAGDVIGAEYVTWDLPDGQLEPTLDVRWRIVREIRTFAPDLVLTHRPCDYHPDHRAVGQAVQDASYLVTVPGVLSDVPVIGRDPVVAYMPDLFRRPYPMTADVVIDTSEYIDTIVAMLACHRSQVYEWLPYEEGVLDQVPEDEAARLRWLRDWFAQHVRPRADRFRDALMAAYGQDRGSQIEFAEVYEISEYARPLDDVLRARLFPG
jgi:N-acetylglucosamine malate deacetylase 1